MEMNPGKHLIAEIVVFLCLLHHESVTADELETHLTIFNTVRPVTQSAVQKWLENSKHACVLLDVSAGNEGESFEPEDRAAVLWCSLKHYLYIRKGIGHIQHDIESGKYSVTLKGRVYFDSRRKALEIHKSVQKKTAQKEHA